MSDSEDFGETFVRSEVVFPVLPRPSWWARNADTVRELGLGTLSSGCALAPFGFGGDMTLTAIVLSAGWVLGSIALGTVPQKSFAWKSLAILLLFVFFCAETGFLYWHFHGTPQWEWLDRLRGKTEPTFAKFSYVPAPLPPPALPPSPPRPQLQSTNARVIYRCWHEEKTATELSKETAAYKKEADILGDTLGYSTEIKNVLGGIRIIVTPKTQELRQSMIQ